MYPDQNTPGGIVPGPDNQYDFITSPSSPSLKKRLIPNFGGNSFLPKIILIVGGALILMLLLWIVAIVFRGSSANIDAAVSLTQSQQEMIRVAEQGKDTHDQRARNFAMNVQLTMSTQQKEWFEFLEQRGRKVNTKELGQKHNAETDSRFVTAKQSNTFDLAFTQIIENLLRVYASDLDSAFSASEIGAEQALLAEHYQETQLLLRQVPR